MPTGSTNATIVLQALGEIRSSRPFVLVGLGGHGAAGKTTLARSLPASHVVGTDEFWDGAGFALDRLRSDVLDPILGGRPATYRAFSWATQRHEPEPRSVRPEGLIVVEGVCALRRDLRDAYDLRVWLETPPGVRLARIMARGGPDARVQWEERWLPSEMRYVERDDPVAAAQLILDGS